MIVKLFIVVIAAFFLYNAYVISAVKNQRFFAQDFLHTRVWLGDEDTQKPKGNLVR